MTTPRAPELGRHQFLWLDLETTGLDPHACRILEWAVVLAADDAEGDMSPIEQYSGVVGVFSEKELTEVQAEMDPYVLNMHTNNGLLAEVVASESTLAESEEFLIGIANELGAKPRTIVLAGSTVAFDLGFIHVHMPRFAEFLSHRCFDVSTLKMAERAWKGEPFKKAEAHRALPDVLESLAHAAEIRARRWA